MEPTEAPTNSLNASQKLHLLTCSQHADKLLGEIEFILAASASKSPFPKYRQDIAPPQAKVVVAALSSHGKRLESWFRRTTSDFEARFDSYADTYRAQLERLTNQNRATPKEEAAIRRDLTEIGLR